MRPYFSVNSSFTCQVYRSRNNTSIDIICEFLCSLDRIVSSDDRSSIRNNILDRRCCKDLSSDKYRDLFSLESFCKLCKYSLPFIIKKKFYLWLTYLSKSYSCCLEVFITENLTVLSLSWCPFTRSFIDEDK